MNIQDIFVVQKHDASNLHYDLRIEIGGTLVSWAVPKGPSLDPSIKRLAIRTEDHPLDYADFEGVIPEGEYGAGIVMVWDRGECVNNKEDKELKQSLEDGHIVVFLKGDKLYGEFSLTRINKYKDQWLIVKSKDEYADPSKEVLDMDTSVISGKTIEEIK